MNIYSFPYLLRHKEGVSISHQAETSIPNLNITVPRNKPSGQCYPPTLHVLAFTEHLCPWFILPETLFPWFLTWPAPSHLWSLNFKVSWPSFQKPAPVWPLVSPLPCLRASGRGSLPEYICLVIYLFPACLAWKVSSARGGTWLTWGSTLAP